MEEPCAGQAGAADSSSRSRAQLSRAVPTVFHIATICSTGAKALLARIEAASMPPGVSSRSSTSQAPSPITPLCTTRRTNRVKTVMAPPRSAAAWVRASAVPPSRTSRAVSVSSMPRPDDGLAPALHRLGEACGLLLALAGLAQGPLRGEIVGDGEQRQQQRACAHEGCEIRVQDPDDGERQRQPGSIEQGGDHRPDQGLAQAGQVAYRLGCRCP